jgi:hypothetical protein
MRKGANYATLYVAMYACHALASDSLTLKPAAALHAQANRSPVAPDPTSSNPSTTAGTANPTNTTPYQDRVINDSGLTPSTEEAGINYNSAGWPRQWSAQWLSDRQSRTALGLSTQSRSQGLHLAGSIETPDYGTFSGDLNLRNTDGGAATLGNWVVRQIGMPFEGGWRADHTLGLLGTPVPELGRVQQRFIVPGVSIRGISAQWYQQQGNVPGELGPTWQASTGGTGQISGFPQASFQTDGGRVSTLGFQSNAAAWSWASYVARGNQLPTPSLLGTQTLDYTATYAALRYRAAAWQVQANILASEPHIEVSGTSGAGGSRAGLWLEATTQQTAYNHNGGAFYLPVGLRWLNTALANDLQGVFYRTNYVSRQWTNDASLELLQSVSGQTAPGWFGSAASRYQVDSATGLGAGLNLRRYLSNDQSAFAYVQHSHALGQTRGQVDVASAQSGERNNRLQLDHEWRFGASAYPGASSSGTWLNALRLSHTLTLERLRSATGMRGTGRSVAMLLGWEPGGAWSLQSSLLYRKVSSALASDAGDSLNFSLSAAWRMNPQWSLSLTAYQNTGVASNGLAVTSPLVAPSTTTTRPKDKGVFVALRYQDAAGSPSAPTGGAPGSAAGKLTGSIYLDENKNAKRDAAERGAANVTVLLDGRYAVQTDAQGRFEFAFVVAGPHVLTVISDNLPLPWQLDKDGRTELRVYTRETSTVDIGAIKP